jgi:hypothetical protein
VSDMPLRLTAARADSCGTVSLTKLEDVACHSKAYVAGHDARILSLASISL